MIANDVANMVILFKNLLFRFMMLLMCDFFIDACFVL